MPKDVLELLASFPGKFRKHRNGKIWYMVPHCLMWGIWRERNVQIFECWEVDLRLEDVFFPDTVLVDNCFGGLSVLFFV